jgi:hypothetical protein
MTLGPETSTIETASIEPANVHFEVGWWEENFDFAASSLRSVIKQMR